MQESNLKKAAKQSKRYSFIAEHRGGPLTNEHHRKLIKWARECSEHVLFLIDKEVDSRLLYALEVAKKWVSKKIQKLFLSIQTKMLLIIFFYRLLTFD